MSETDGTPYQALMDVRCSARYHHIAERWYLGLRRIANFMNLFLGSSAAVTALNDMPVVAAVSSLLVVAVSIVDNVYDLYQRFLDLETAVLRNNTGKEEIKAATAQIEKDEPPENEHLSKIAYLANLVTYGHMTKAASRTELSRFERVLAAWL